MSQIGEPQRIITVEPVFEPLPGKEIPDVDIPEQLPGSPDAVPERSEPARTR